MVSLSRREASLGLLCTGMSGLYPTFATANVNETAAYMADVARRYYRTTDWAPGFTWLGNKAYFCNEFVSDVAEEAGAKTWNPIERESPFPLFREPLAREWADRSVKIRGWNVVFDRSMKNQFGSYSGIFSLRRAGDIISNGDHVGIISDEPNSTGNLLVFSASGLEEDNGAIVLNDFGSRIKDTYTSEDALAYASAHTIRRFVGT